MTILKLVEKNNSSKILDLFKKAYGVVLVRSGTSSPRRVRRSPSPQSTSNLAYPVSPPIRLNSSSVQLYPILLGCSTPRTQFVF